MIYELILANVAGEELGNYEDDFKNGTFDFTKYPEATARLQEIAPYFLEGTASALEEDAATYMSDGLAAMCLAGNWNGGMENGAASLPPFGAAGELPYISTSPEDAFCVTENPDRTPAEQEALEIFFNWLFEGENFQLIQNARGTVPVITSMTEDQIVLPEAMVPVAAEMGSAPFVLMGFNLYSAEFKDAVMAKIQGVLTGDNTAEDAEVSPVSRFCPAHAFCMGRLRGGSCPPPELRRAFFPAFSPFALPNVTQRKEGSYETFFPRWTAHAA